MTKVSNLLQSVPWTIDEIALRSRLPSERVRDIIAGKEASLADLRALSRALKIPLRSFTSQKSAQSPVQLLFRSSVDQRPDRGVEAAAAFVQAALDILPQRTELPHWLSAFDVQAETYPEAARVADEFRLRFVPDRLNEPLTDLPQIAERSCEIILGQLETSKFEGASGIADRYPFVFVSPRFSGRMLFTLAHEIGHLIAHHKNGRFVIFDRASQIGDGRRSTNRSEQFVNAFASVLLMPATGVGLALQHIRSLLKINADSVGDVELLYLARFFGVSFDVAAKRCEDLELLPPGGARSLSEVLRDKHGGAEKRAAALNLPPRPKIDIPRVSENLMSVAAEKVKRGELSVGWVTDRLGCTINDVYRSHFESEVIRGPHH
jgi:Zn-dependent peptidase ImmA (M78 family)